MIFVYFGRTFTVTAHGMEWRQQTCEQCGETFHFPAVFEAVGVAESPYLLTDERAARRAEQRAATALAKAAATTTVAVPCAHCGWFQRAMIPTFRAMLWPQLGRVGNLVGIAGAMLGMIAAVIWIGEGSADNATDPAVVGKLAVCGLFAGPGLVLLGIRRWKQATFDPNRDLTRGLRLRMAAVSCLTAADFAERSAADPEEG